MPRPGEGLSMRHQQSCADSEIVVLYTSSRFRKSSSATKTYKYKGQNKHLTVSVTVRIMQCLPSVCLSVCLSKNRITQKVDTELDENFWINNFWDRENRGHLRQRRRRFEAWFCSFPYILALVYAYLSNLARWPIVGRRRILGIGNPFPT